MERFQLFQKALPVWPKGRAEEVNLTCRFFTQIPQHQQAKLLVAASSLYRLFVNGSFAAYGPARGPKGYFRVDEIDLTPFLTQGANSLCIEVTGYNCNSFYLMNQPSFLLAEVTAGGQILAHTARAGRFACSVVTQRVQKLQLPAPLH